jgi:hypothetical protein
VDCEKFDRVVLDLLYEELDELTSAAAKRHMEHCARCRDIGSGLRATRQIGILPLVEAPAGLEESILQAEEKARTHLPARQRFGRAVSVMAGYAMRPQLAMAALLLLMIGSSLVFLRARPGERDHVRVTERGVPESEAESVAVVPIPEKARAGESSDHGAPSEARRERGGGATSDEPAAGASKDSDKPMDSLATTGGTTGDAGSGDAVFDQAMSDFRSGRYGDAQKSFDVVASAGGGNAPTAALFAARSIRSDSGCSAAAPRFESVSTKHRGSNVGNEAAWQAADCYRSLGQLEDAKRNYKLLVGVAGYAERAELALNEMDQERVAAKSPAPTPPAAAAPAKAKAAAKPAGKTTESKKAAPPAAENKSGF